MACAHCVESIPVLDLRQLHIGDHIEFGRCSYIKTFLNCLLGYCPINKHIRLGYLYFHHAIVTEIDHARRKITLIEFAKEDTSLSSFYKSFSKPIIRERQMNFDDIHEHMYRVVHKNLGSSPPNSQQIVKNARHMLDKAKDERYNGFLNNCEHVANWCVTKRRISIQINQITERNISRLLSKPPKWFKCMIGYLGKFLLKFVQRFEKVLERMEGSKLFPAFSFIKRYLGSWLACAFIIAMILMAMDIIRFHSAWRNEELCGSCVQRWVVKTAYRVLSMLPFGMFLFICAVGFRFTGFLTYDSLYRKSYTYTELLTLRTIKPGDVITFNLYMPFSFHDVVVVKSIETLTAGNMQPLKKPLSSMSEAEVFEQSLSMLNDFFRDNITEEEYCSFQYLRMNAKTSEKWIKPGTSDQEVDVFQENSRTRTIKRHGYEWKFTTDVKDKEDIPSVCFLYDDKNIKFYHGFCGTYEVEIVHYDLERGLRFPDVFIQGKRVVKFERKTLNPGKKHTIYQKDYAKISAAYRNSPGNTVGKALKKIGERQWTFSSRWSSHLADECALVDPESYYSRGYRFSRIVHTRCFELLYAETTHRLSGLAVLDYVLSHINVDHLRLD
ncbi:uncharacterized protein LOC125675962 [Ostrea edulis]|uniref:uncharacterized protein LOC125675962 n=1 Tax=Ostrea edulis TaxID=37623 RepID=UPI0024AF6606|nr:uncharacterized protein LOC125675962 [Ostrea edulis]